ncbi:unnamed protein product [Kuraishia capsulata CBS 1993]|uniref:Association with the SNF1 complex (ASC) domain-containing protein n=1 Tax=Kuraishia capsulata CBS 1993 TaxID=1382522 RepID=W6MI13_9ASCO|nr:uncharacterized protein KUCA_T00001701001 [Kuraishia capsulata CBS 1993]CDK25731.1 unnamed protein product [Kuraishia capsulata CBS 1993]
MGNTLSQDNAETGHHDHHHHHRHHFQHSQTPNLEPLKSPSSHQSPDPTDMQRPGFPDSSVNLPESQHFENGSPSSEDVRQIPSKDVSMVDVSGDARLGSSSNSGSNSRSGSAMNLDSADELAGLQPLRRKSTLILTDDIDFERLKLGQRPPEDDMVIDDDGDLGQVPPPVFKQDDVGDENSSTSNDVQQQQSGRNAQRPPEIEKVPTVIRWTEGGSKVYVTGTFTGGGKMFALNGPSSKDGSFSIKLDLVLGTHRFRFIVDNEIRISNFIPTATDQMGNLVNYLEVVSRHHEERSSSISDNKSRSSLTTMDSKLGLTRDDDDMGDGYSRYHDEDEAYVTPETVYTTSVPAIFTDPKVMEQYYLTLDNQQNGTGNNNQQWLIPPQLPPHLENVILNSYNNADKDNTSGALSIPNHVVLNHLATTSIKHNTLAVASVVRYKKKYVTQILYAPLQ